MPWEKKGPNDRTLVIDTLVAICRKNAVILHWPEALLTPAVQQTLALLVENLTTFGRAEGGVLAELTEHQTTEWNCIPGDHAGTGEELISVFCPDPATAFASEHYPPDPDPKKMKKGLKPDKFLFVCSRWHLYLDTETIHAKRWPQIPGAVWVSYVRPHNCFSAFPSDLPPKPKTMTPRYTVACFVLDGPVLPLVTQTLPLAEVARRTLMGCFQHLLHRRRFGSTHKPYRQLFHSRIFSGKDEQGRPLTSHGHAFYLPPCENDQGQLDHLTLYSQDGFGPDELASLYSFRQLTLEETELRLQLVGLERPDDFRCSLFGPAAIWVSATPFLVNRHLKVRGRKKTPSVTASMAG